MALQGLLRHDGAMTTSTPTQQSTELVRPIDGRVIAGVAAGLGRRFALNPWLFRIGFIVLALFGGFGLILYGIGWLLVPEEGADEAILPGWIGGSRGSSTGTIVGVALIAVAALILLSSLDILSGPLVFAGALFVIGVLLYRGDLSGSGRSDDDPGGGDYDEGGDVTDTLTPALDDAGGGGDPPPTLAEPTLPPEPSAPEARSRSILGQLTLAATLVALGGLALLDAAGILYPTFTHYVAVALGVIGGGLLVGTLFGRARWLIVIGLVLMPVLFVASVVPRWDFSGEAGDVRYNVASVADLAPEYSLAAGSLRLDLSDFTPDPGVTEIEVGVGAGEVRIDVPSDVAVEVDASVGIGAVDILGDQRAGIGVDVLVEPPVGQPQLVLIVEAGFGNIVVREG